MSSEFWKTIPTHFTLPSKLFITIKAERTFKNKKQLEGPVNTKTVQEKVLEGNPWSDGMLHCREDEPQHKCSQRIGAWATKYYNQMTETDTHLSVRTLIIKHGLNAPIERHRWADSTKNWDPSPFFGPQSQISPSKPNVTLEWKKGWKRILKQMQQKACRVLVLILDTLVRRRNKFTFYWLKKTFTEKKLQFWTYSQQKMGALDIISKNYCREKHIIILTQ